MMRSLLLVLFIDFVSIGKVSVLSSCELCHFLLPIAKSFVELNQTALIDRFGIELCQELHLADDAVCQGMIGEYTPVLLQVLRRSPLTINEICAVAFDCYPQTNISVLKWNVTFPTALSKVVESKLERSTTSNYSILHLADLHIDMHYTPGSNANCGRPLCCRDEIPKSPTDAAAFWGDYRTCDIPPWTAEKIFDYLIENEKQIDWIYFTGDIAPHDVWQQTKSKDLDEISFTTRLLRERFAPIRIYPCVGNHESAPPDLFEPENMSWLYSYLASQWIDQWGLDPSTRETILLGGFYTTKITSTLRLISLNMNFCSENNYWMFINSTDPLGQLQWLIQWLQYAEDHGEKVHLIGHHPPRMCLVSFSWAYASIVHRYQQTITGQFFAHTHNDELMVFYDEKNSTKPMSVAYVTPSFTTYPNLNPAYRFYTIDLSSNIIDHRTVVLNLTATNLYNSTNFFTEYSARSAYGLIDLSPQSWNNFLIQLENDLDGEMIKRVYQYFIKSSPAPPQCDSKCRLKLIRCQFRTAKAEDTTFCSN